MSGTSSNLNLSSGDTYKLSLRWVIAIVVAMILLFYLVYTDLTGSKAFPLKSRYRLSKCGHVEQTMPPGLFDACLPPSVASAVNATVGIPATAVVSSVMPAVSPATAAVVSGFSNRGFTSFTDAVNGGRRMMDQSVRS
uniref:Uncharacterized protein n=1 Tax=viral metagenome TaxID=1070528 RepID=A0A6C0BBM3_9ZZZZ